MIKLCIRWVSGEPWRKVAVRAHARVQTLQRIVASARGDELAWANHQFLLSDALLPPECVLGDVCTQACTDLTMVQTSIPVSSVNVLKLTSSQCHHEHVIQLLVVGDVCVGKSSFQRRFMENLFLQTDSPTVGIEFRCCNLEYAGQRVKLRIWEWPARPRTAPTRCCNIQHIDGLFMLYDVTSWESFTEVSRGFAFIDEHVSSGLDKVLVGTKCDTACERVVAHGHGEALANELRIPFIEVSSKTGTNIDAAFATILGNILHRVAPPKFLLLDM